jgi:hypothetical protein
MNKFLDAYQSRDINHLNRAIRSNEIETVIKRLPTKKNADQMDSLLNSVKHFNKNKQQCFSNYSIKYKGKKHCLNTFL